MGNLGLLSRTWNTHQAPIRQTLISEAHNPELASSMKENTELQSKAIKWEELFNL